MNPPLKELMNVAAIHIVVFVERTTKKYWHNSTPRDNLATTKSKAGSYGMPCGEVLLDDAPSTVAGFFGPKYLIKAKWG
jgi:hypothetical protein